MDHKQRRTSYLKVHCEGESHASHPRQEHTKIMVCFLSRFCYKGLLVVPCGRPVLHMFVKFLQAESLLSHFLLTLRSLTPKRIQKNDPFKMSNYYIREITRLIRGSGKPRVPKPKLCNKSISIYVHVPLRLYMYVVCA